MFSNWYLPNVDDKLSTYLLGRMSLRSSKAAWVLIIEFHQIALKFLKTVQPFLRNRRRHVDQILAYIYIVHTNTFPNYAKRFRLNLNRWENITLANRTFWQRHKEVIWEVKNEVIINENRYFIKWISLIRNII